MVTTFNSAKSPDEVVPYLVRFWLLLVSFILSVPCSLFILYHLLVERTTRQALHNHVVIVLLITNLSYQIIDIPLSLSFYRTGTVLLTRPDFCLFWVFTDETLFSLTIILVAGATIQRHILIFQNQWLSTSRKRFFVHYLPMITIAVYIIVFHTSTILFVPCENTFNYNLSVCGRPLCSYQSELLAMWDIIINDIVPTLLIVIFSIALLIRVIHQKHRIFHHVQWRKHRKMTVQMLSIALLYFCLYIPLMCLEMIRFCCIKSSVEITDEVVVGFLAYYVMFLFPFVNLLSLPKYTTKIKNLFLFCRRMITRVIPCMKYFLNENRVVPLYPQNPLQKPSI